MTMCFRALLLAAWVAAPCAAVAQGAGDYPTKPVRVIVAGGAGGGVDVQSRMYAQKLGEIMKHSFVVENRAGAGGTIGYAAVAQAAPDGYTLLTTSPGFTFGPALYPKLPYDPLKSFTPISLLNKTASMLIVHPSLPVKTVKDVIALARSQPGVLNVAVTYGGSNHLFAAYFISAANIKVAIIPYKGGQQDAVDIVSGQVHMLMGNLSSWLPLARAGRVRPIAITTSQRSTAIPEIPTIAESGIPGFEATSWHGWVAPAGTPPAIVNKLSEELAKTVKAPDILKRLAEDGGIPVGSSPAEFQKLLADEVPRWRKVVNETGIKAD